jgi:type II secretory pathway component PulM
VNELLASARDFWDKLSERERMLLGATGALAALVAGFFLVLSPLLAFAERTSSGVGSAEQQLELMKRLQRDYAEVTARLAVVEKRIRARGQNSNLLTLLESLASSSGVKIESMEERQAQANETYRETKVEVELKSVTLTQTVDYLNNIERSPQLLSVKSLRVKRRTDKTATLDVTFAVSSFEPL